MVSFGDALEVAYIFANFWEKIVIEMHLSNNWWSGGMIHKKSLKSKSSLHGPFKVNPGDEKRVTLKILSIRLFCSLHLGNKFQQVETGDKESLIGKQHFHKYSCSYLVDCLKTLPNFQSQQRICWWFSPGCWATPPPPPPHRPTSSVTTTTITACCSDSNNNNEQIFLHNSRTINLF